VYATICVLIAAAIGVVLSSFVTPFLLLVAGLLLKVAAWLGVSTGFATVGTAAIERWARYQLHNFARLLDSTQHIHSIAGLASSVPLLAQVSTVTIPALVVSVLVWMRLRMINLRTGGRDVLEMRSVRAPQVGDRDEHRLSNILEVVAIAAGIPTPRLFVVDEAVVNAAAVGSSARNASVLVTRGLIDSLTRPEIEAIMGRLVAAICAGDLAVAQSVQAAFQSLGLLVTLIDLPVRLGAWRALVRFMHVGLTPAASPNAVARMTIELEHSLEAETIADVDDIAKRFPARLIAPIVMLLLWPFALISALFKLVLVLWTSMFMRLPLWLMWRSRVLWTDATAARRNLDPEELASALGKLTELPEGAELRAYLFLGHPGNSHDAKPGHARAMSMALVPPSAARTKRLSALAGRVRAGAPDGRGSARSSPAVWLAWLIFIVILAPFLVLMIPLGLVLIFLVLNLTLVVMMFALAAGLGLVIALV